MKLSVFVLLGGIAGLVGSCVPWGSHDRFHGVGFPVATVLWDAPNGTMIDFPNPLAYVINPTLGVLFGCLIFGFIRLISRITRK
jgi:hypothetical protein